jgi:hypothetical protein
MAQPICIVTPGGMICSASPLKSFNHGSGTYNPNHTHPQPDKAKLLKDKMAEPGAGFTADEQDLIGRVVDVMLAAGVKSEHHFTIVHSK